MKPFGAHLDGTGRNSPIFGNPPALQGFRGGGAERPGTGGTGPKPSGLPVYRLFGGLSRISFRAVDDAAFRMQPFDALGRFYFPPPLTIRRLHDRIDNTAVNKFVTQRAWPRSPRRL
jgi:hypothetical protein